MGGSGNKVKRLLEGSSDSSGEEGGENVAKVAKVSSAPTDFLVEKKAEQKKKVWERSIGSLGGGTKLGMLVKKKKPANNEGDSVKTAGESTGQSGDSFVPGKEVIPAGNCSVPRKEGSPAGNSSVVNSGSALGLLGAYSDSDSAGSD